jgi:hypothetical protein
MAEQFRFDQGRRQGGTVQGHQGALPPPRQIVQATGRQFLAGPPLADQQHRPFHRGDPGQPLLELEKALRLAKGLAGAGDGRFALSCLRHIHLRTVSYTIFWFILPFIRIIDHTLAARYTLSQTYVTVFTSYS